MGLNIENKWHILKKPLENPAVGQLAVGLMKVMSKSYLVILKKEDNYK